MIFPEKVEFYLHEQNYPDFDHLFYYIYTKKEKRRKIINLLLRLYQQFCCHVSTVVFIISSRFWSG